MATRDRLRAGDRRRVGRRADPRLGSLDRPGSRGRRRARRARRRAAGRDRALATRPASTSTSSPSAALDARPDRRVIVTDDDNFPTDQYVLQGLAAARGLELRVIKTDIDDGVTPRRRGARPSTTDTALVSLSHVAYRSGAIADIAGDHRGGARRRRADAVGPVPLGRLGAGRTGRRPAPIWPSAARTSTSTAVRARPRSSTSGPTCSRLAAVSRSGAGSPSATSSRWAARYDPVETDRTLPGRHAQRS